MHRRHHRVAATVLVSVLAALVFAAPASAQTAARYHTNAQATALNLQLFGQGITLGVAQSAVSEQPIATGRGVGLILPGDTFVTEEKKEVTGADGAQTSDPVPVCGPITLPPEFPLIDLASACANATATIGGGLPSANADGTVATLDVNPEELAPVTDAVNEAVGTVIDELKPVFDALDEADIDADTLIKDVLAAITDGGDIVRVTLGPAHAESAATGTAATSTAKAQGAVIELLPRDLLQLEPVVTIEVGAATSTVSVDRASGTPEITFDPAIVRVTIAPDILATLPEGVPGEVEIAPGVSQCLGLPAPLDSCITVAGGTKGQRDDTDKTHFGEAAGVSLHLLTGVEDGIRLDLARTVVEGFAVTDVPRQDTTPEAPLARTGGSTPLALLATVIGIAFVGTAFSRAARRDGLLRSH